MVELVAALALAAGCPQCPPRVAPPRRPPARPLPLWDGKVTRRDVPARPAWSWLWRPR